MDVDLHQMLEWLAFEDDEINQLEEEGFITFEDFVQTSQEELKSMVDGFYRRTDININIPIKRRKTLYDFCNWCQDFDRRDMDAGLNWPGEEINDEDDATDAMYTARERAVVRKSLKAKSSSDEIKGPGVFTPDDYVHWQKALDNKLASLTGIKDVPLSYVIRKIDVANPEDLIGQSFLARTVLQTPISGATFEADSREVHQIIVANTSGTDAEQFLKTVFKYDCGRRDMEVLRAFYEGTGSTNRRMLEAKALLKHIHYKSERTMPFATFSAKLTGIFQCLQDGGQEKGDPEKVELFFEKFLCDSLSGELIGC